TLSGRVITLSHYFDCPRSAVRPPPSPARSRRSPVTSPFVRRQRLATELRTLREERGITADELAKQIFRSRTTISKLENARTRPDMGDVYGILRFLKVPEDKCEELYVIARETADRGWWDHYGDTMGARQRMYANIESGAATIREYH